MHKELSIQFERLIVYPDGDPESMSIGKEVDFNEEAREFIAFFNQKFAAHLHKNKDGLTGEEYIFDDRETDFDEIFSLLLPHDHCIDFWMDISTAYEVEDYDEADAFLMSFPKACYYYDEPDEEAYNSFVVLCEDKRCWTSGHTEKMYIRPNNGLKKAFAGKCMGASTAEGINIVSDMMYEYLLDNGIGEEYFRPVYQRNGEIWAHYIYCDEHIIPSLSLLSDPMDLFSICPVCNRKKIMNSRYVQARSLCSRFRKGAPFGQYPLSERMRIHENALGDLGEANLTEDYWFGGQYDVVSKKLFELIRAKIPKIIKTSEPIFKDEFDVIVRDGWIVRI